MNLIPGVELSKLETRRLRRKHRICMMTGHIWEALGYDPATGRVPMRCNRCFPALDSVRTGYLTSLMPEVSDGSTPN